MTQIAPHALIMRQSANNVTQCRTWGFRLQLGCVSTVLMLIVYGALVILYVVTNAPTDLESL